LTKPSAVIILNLEDMIGLTITEMADMLGISPNTVKQRLFRVGLIPMTKCNPLHKTRKSDTFMQWIAQN
jgi:Mn-dependent DtxR family transcriptional regulator